MAHFPIIFALFWKTWLASVKCGPRVVHNFFDLPMVQSSQGGARYLWKSRARSDSLVILSLYPSLSLQSLLMAKHMWLKWN